MTGNCNRLSGFRLGILATTLVCASAFAQSTTTGPRLKEAGSTLKAVFPNMTRSTEQAFLPVQNGGSTFGGLVSRLLGEAPRRELEGLEVRRHIYHVFAKDQKIGVAHGSTVEFEGRDVNVFVFYDPTGKIVDLRAEGFAEADLARLNTHFEQFRGTDATDFEVKRGRRGRITSRGAFIGSAKRPSDPRVRNAFEKVLRAVRFNAAFMDVAYFIKEHPDLADDNRIALSEPLSGPEAFVRSREVAASSKSDSSEEGKKAESSAKP